MTDNQEGTDNRIRHFGALVAGVVAFISVFIIPSGMIWYFVMVAISIVAVVTGHRAIKFRGRFIWAAIVGLVLSYFILLFSALLLFVRTILIFRG